MTYSVWRQSSKDWVRPLVIPYIAIFCVAAITSVGTIGYKCRMVLTKLCKRSSESTDWHVDVAHDRETRRDFIGKLTSHEQSYNTVESQSIASGVAFIEIFSSSLSSEAGSQARWKFDANSNRLICYTEGIVRGASPEDVIAYLMDIESRFIQADQNRDVMVRFEILEKVNDHHNAIFTEVKTAPFTNRTFVNSLICRKILDDPPTWAWVAIPVPGHARVRPEDERGTVRAEVFRSVRVTAMSDNECRMEYACWLDLRGNFPTWFTDRVALPNQLQSVLPVLPCIAQSRAC
jgi:hypothetical protein